MRRPRSLLRTCLIVMASVLGLAAGAGGCGDTENCAVIRQALTDKATQCGLEINQDALMCADNGTVTMAMVQACAQAISGVDCTGFPSNVFIEPACQFMGSAEGAENP